MKKFIYTLSFIAIAMAFTGSSALAQSSTRIEADVPFAFALGEKVLEAGKYTMRISNVNSAAEVLEVRNGSNKVIYSAVMIRNGATARKNPHLVFDQVEGQPVLAKIALDSKGFDVPVEKSAVTTLAARNRTKRTSGGTN